MSGLWLVAGAVVVALVCAFAVAVRSRQMHLWLGGYLRRCLAGRPRAQAPRHIFLCVCDHFEPAWSGADLPLQRARVDSWTNRFPAMANAHRDWLGRPYQHTFFFPAEEYVAEHLDKLAALSRAGYGDVEVHLHHRNDTSDGVRDQLLQFTSILHDRHGLLRRDAAGRISYAFIHGNWALDNSARDGDWCGVNDELIVLKETGCYADFTFPSAPSETQPRTINSIYYATDDPLRPKSHDRGVPVVAGEQPQGDLLLIQGPLTLNWRSRKLGLMPRIENGDLSGDNPPSPERARLWIDQHIHVVGRADWVFVKLHTHGAQERNMEALLGGEMDRTLTWVEKTFNDGAQNRLYYVTARQMYDLVKAAEANVVADPAEVLRVGVAR